MSDFKAMIAASVARELGKSDEQVKEDIKAIDKQPLHVPQLDDSLMMDIPDIAGTVPGWRTWGIEERTDAPPLLHSVTRRNYVWAAREIQTAVCNKGTHLAPEEKCTCGMYSAKDYDHLMSMSYHQYDAENWGYFSAVGEVANWGKVIEGTQGWRAQHSYPIKLYVPFEAFHLAMPLQEAYGVRVELKNFLGLSYEELVNDNS